MKIISIIACKEFRDRLRSGWVIASIFLWFAAILLTSFFGLLQIGRIGVQGYERTTMSLLNLAQYLAPLLGLLVGHDSIIKEREDRTLHLIVASGVRRADILFGKSIGAALTVIVSLLLGFVVAGTLIGAVSREATILPFVKLSASAIALGTVFAGFGALVSTFARNRVQALVGALLVWGFAVFAFDLIALGIIVSNKAPKAALEIDMICDATHVNEQADLHSSFDGSVQSQRIQTSNSATLSWAWFNPVDVFRLLNLPSSPRLSLTGALMSLTAWLAFSSTAAAWRLKRIDL